MTVKKSGLVQDLRTKFFEMLKAEEDVDFNPSTVVFAEVKNHANVKIIVRRVWHFFCANAIFIISIDH